MRIFALATDAFGGRGGIAQSNRHLFEALARFHEVTIHPRYAPDPVQGLAPRIVQKPPRSGKFVYAAAAWKDFFGSEKFDLIFCGHLFMAPLARLLAKKACVPFWLQVHGIEAWKRPGRWVRDAASQASVVTAVSRFTRRRFLEWARIAPEKVRVLPNTFSERFKPGAKSETLLKRWGIAGKKIVLTVGRLASGERYKGVDRLIRALPAIRRRFPEILCVVAGEGGDRPRLEALARTAGVQDAVKFVGSPSDEELPDVYRLADVFAMPSTGEGFGIVFLEAAASGVPVVGGNRDGSFDALAEGKIGRLVDPEDPDQIEEAVCGSLERPAVTSKELRRFSRENFEKMVGGLLDDLSAGLSDRNVEHATGAVQDVLKSR